MPRFGWKCFIGSFLFSLVVVFAAAKVSFLLPENEQDSVETNFDDLRAKDIELFATSEETNPIAEKFKQINSITAKQTLDTAAMQNTKSTEKPVVTAAAEPIALPSDEPALSADSGNEILFAPEDDELDSALSEKEDNSLELAKNSDSGKISAKTEKNPETADAENEEPLKIADASEAKMFSIPIMHNFSEPKKDVKVSSEAENSQVALASDNVRLQNLGTTNRLAMASVETNTESNLAADREEPYSDPWIAASTGNEHISKNQMNAKDDVAPTALAVETPEPAKPEKESKVAYKMMKNILIPIPEDIANDENLTPQLSYSEENKKLSERLKQSGELGDTAAKDDEPKKDAVSTPLPKAENAAEQSTTPLNSSPSLTDSIAAWFSSSSKKSDEETADKAKKETKSGESAFSKLLGLGRKDNSSIAPSELKLAFQPNRAEISGQTLEWLKAFSDNAVKNDDVFIEIRIDGTGSYELQQKRLNLLYSILVNNGVDYNKINIIFTDREPNSFIIRNVRYASEEDANKARKKAYNPWY
ncbi:MAG: hypothetical protein MR350_07295 [Alphaproteobacteria bacterium]|nr:hypothetical protein [Alphaproteobacteria bacterium]